MAIHFFRVRERREGGREGWGSGMSKGRAVGLRASDKHMVEGAVAATGAKRTPT